MISHLGVKRCFLVMALLFTAAFASGCASGPIDMRASEDGELELIQAELRAQADVLSTRLDEQGWTVSATPAEATRSFLGRLIGGAESVQAPADDPVSVYLADRSADQIGADLNELAADTQSLADQTLVVASADGMISAASLVQDLASVERALGAVRRAKRFFSTVTEDADLQLALTIPLYEMVAAEARLAAAADALAERRWATRSGIFG